MKIHIEWENGIPLTDVSSFQGPTDYGIYQIYGAHPVYGSDVLLYIGKAQQQTFGVRIPQHVKWAFNRDAGNVKVYLGRLGGNKQVDSQSWSEQIDSAEKLLIYSHKPAYNSSNINTMSQIDINTHIFNWGSYRSLADEVSAFRFFSTNEEHYKTYEVFSEEPA